MAITCVPRLVRGLLGGRPTPPVGAEVWGDTRVMLPCQPAAFRDAITGAVIEARGDAAATWLEAASVFEQFPVALLVPVG
jgi:maltooligosyltrehalose synthase